jgi:F-type H+-transporting ATPase subunit b
MPRFFATLCAVALLAAVPALASAEPEAAQAEHATTHQASVHGAAHAEHEAPSFDDINWIYGWLGEREGVEPSIMFRPKGMPAPFAAWFFDALLLYGLLIRVSAKSLRKGLENRKTNIMRGMEEAARMKQDAERRLAEYEKKLARIDEEVERVRREMREDAEAERARILAEARLRQERMQQDAEALVAQELAAAREALSGELIAAAMKSAAEALAERLGPDDHRRLSEEYLAGLAKAGTSLRGRA